jgi:hypothetical protein
MAYNREKRQSAFETSSRVNIHMYISKKEPVPRREEAQNESRGS